MSFTDGKPFSATAEDIKRPWDGDKNGKNFRCALCGHKFKAGDTVRWQFTNDTKGAGGNPFVCIDCDKGKDVIVEEILKRRAEFKSDRHWWFLGRT